MKNKRCILTDFALGIIIGFCIGIIIAGIAAGILNRHRKDKELIEYAEKQIEIEAMREDYSNRAVDELLEIPDVRRAADGATDEFIRRRDEILFEFRNRLAD